MAKKASKTKYPIIITRGDIVFPGQHHSIDIGRNISINALEKSLKLYDGFLIIVMQKDIQKEKIQSAKDFFDIGTLVKVSIDKKVEVESSKRLTIRGFERAKLLNAELSKDDYWEAEIKLLKQVDSPEVNVEKDLVAKITSRLNETIGSMVNVPKELVSSFSQDVSGGELADILCQYIPFSFEKKQSLLEAYEVVRRLKLINEYLEIDSRVSKVVDKDIDNAIRKTLDSQQKEYLLREKMKVIKEQLGDISSKDSEIDEWKKMLENSRFPKYVKEATLDEIKKYEATPPISAESNVIKGYIEWITKLPWNTYSKDNESLEEAKKVLDKYHFGLEKVKERILEHLAVKIKTKSLSAPIVTLVGPPGVGKTSLAKSIAESMNREFVKVSLGGVKDESEIRGHRRTYVGAMPGKIIQAFKKAKTSNPVILLDEIDKMSADYKGDPTSAMLEVLDPEQNVHFQDHFLELEYDLSQVMFIATANYYNQIPRPLLDRVEIIFLDQYTSEEKLHIAKDYLIPKILKNNGLKKKQFGITNTIIEEIIAKYTQEAGVRELNRLLDKLARKIVVKILNGEVTEEFDITRESISKMLGKEVVYKEKLEGSSEVGLVNGMYFSEVGGGILKIEVTTYDSDKGGVALTGSVKDVMKESLNVAVAYIRANAKKFGVDFDWEHKTIQVHVPAGAVPKDGPSAGVAFTTAILSALLNKPISKEIAMTGEITLHGRVLPIGGLKEKSLGSVEAGVRTIFIPKENERDLDELSKKVHQKARIISINDYQEAFKYIFQ